MTLVKYGPLAANTSGHAMALTGWKDYSDGTLMWILKDSNPADATGLRFVNGPELVGVYRTAFTSCLTYSQSDRRCLDLDDDGFYNWGIGTKPTNCPACPDKEDGDDSNPNIGPVNEDGQTTPCPARRLNSDLTISTNGMSFCMLIIYSGTLTVTSSCTIQGGSILVKEGGKLVIDGANVLIGGLFVQSGGSVVIKNNGYLKGTLNIDHGATLDYSYGSIDINP